MAVEGGTGPVQLRPPADLRPLEPLPEAIEAGAPTTAAAPYLTPADQLERAPARHEVDRRREEAQRTLDRTAMTEALRPDGNADGRALYGAAKGLLRETLMSTPEHELPLGLGALLRGTGLVRPGENLTESGDRLEEHRDGLRDDGRDAWLTAYDESPILSLATGGLVAAASVAALGRTGTDQAHLDDLGFDNFQTRLWQGGHLRVSELSFEKNFRNLGGELQVEQEINVGANRLGLSLASHWAGGDVESHTATARWQRGAAAVELGGSTDARGAPSDVRFGLAYSGLGAEIRGNDTGVSAHATYQLGGLQLDVQRSEAAGDAATVNYGLSF